MFRDSGANLFSCCGSSNFSSLKCKLLKTTTNVQCNIIEKVIVVVMDWLVQILLRQVLKVWSFLGVDAVVNPVSVS